MIPFPLLSQALKAQVKDLRRQLSEVQDKLFSVSQEKSLDRAYNQTSDVMELFMHPQNLTLPDKNPQNYSCPAPTTRNHTLAAQERFVEPPNQTWASNRQYVPTEGELYNDLWKMLFFAMVGRWLL